MKRNKWTKNSAEDQKTKKEVWRELMGLAERGEDSGVSELTTTEVEERLSQMKKTLRHSDRHLVHEIYRCVVPVGLALGACCLLEIDYLNGGAYVLKENPMDTSDYRFVPRISRTTQETSGPAYILCALPSTGGPPYVCGKHWLEGRKNVEEVRRRLLKEGRRLLRKS